VFSTDAQPILARARGCGPVLREETRHRDDARLRRDLATPLHAICPGWRRLHPSLVGAWTSGWCSSPLTVTSSSSRRMVPCPTLLPVEREAVDAIASSNSSGSRDRHGRSSAAVLPPSRQVTCTARHIQSRSESSRIRHPFDLGLGRHPACAPQTVTEDRTRGAQQQTGAVVQARRRV
jgi:hypothetical protein